MSNNTAPKDQNNAPYPLATETWDDKEYAAIQRVIDSGRFSMGPEVKKFEEDFAAHFGSKYAVMVNSGSSANLLTLAALFYAPEKYLQPGDEVIVPAVSWSTTYYPVHQYGLSLRFVDVDPATLNIDPDLIEAAITPKTKGIFAVNLLGNPCDFDRLHAICKKHNLVLFEDNCESMGAKYAGRYAGTHGICGTFSTFFSHHISTMEGGVVVTDDEALYHTMLSLRAHGWTREQPENSHLKSDIDPFSSLFRFVLPGYNLRPLEMSGAIGQEQIRKLSGLVDARRKNASLFKDLFQDHEALDIQQETHESSWFGFSLVLKGKLEGRRAEIVKMLQDNNVECRPIVAGNFLNNPVIQHLNHSIGSEIKHADYLDTNGLFIGNHHYDISQQLERTHQLISKL